MKVQKKDFLLSLFFYEGGKIFAGILPLCLQARARLDNALLTVEKSGKGAHLMFSNLKKGNGREGDLGLCGE